MTWETNVWHPIDAFDFNAPYAAHPFLVWLPDGRFNECWIEDGKFVGEWRYVGTEEQPDQQTNEMEPVAFMRIGAPSFVDAQAANEVSPQH